MTIDTHQNILQKNFVRLYKYASIGIILLNEKGEILESNSFFKKLFDYNDQEIVGLLYTKLIVCNQQSEELLLKLLLENNNINNTIETIELIGKRKDGSTFPIEVNISIHNFNHKKYVLGFVHDISLKIKDKIHIQKLYNELEKNIENRTKELNKTLEVLSVINEKLEVTLANQNAILDNASIMLFLMDKNGVIQFFNPAAIKLTGYRPCDIINKSSPAIFHDQMEIDIYRQEILSCTGKKIIDDWQVIKEKVDKNQLKEVECKYKKKDGSTIDVLLTLSPIYDRRKNINGYLGAAVNISERKKLEINLLEALKNEKKLGELKTNFISIASHEFRTPLSTIMSSAFLIEKYKLSSQQSLREKHLQRIINATSNLTNILNDFLSVGKIDEGKISINYTHFNLKKIVQQLIQELNTVLKNGQMIHYVHKGECMVTLDCSLIKNICINLLSNAIKFSPENAPIHIQTENNSKEIIFYIKDEGIGISKKDQEHLMDRFYRASNAININGTGLGLHIVSKYVERMEGEISYQSQLNKGTTFTVTFKKKKQHENNFTY